MTWESLRELQMWRTHNLVFLNFHHSHYTIGHRPASFMSGRVDLLRLLDQSDINTVIMDYLIKEGYPDSARKFAIEANIKQRPDDESIRMRVEIRNAIQAGDIQSAIDKINDLNPEVRLPFLTFTSAVALIKHFFMHHS